MAFRVPYHRYWFGPEEEQAVLEVLRSGWLTTGPRATQFEADFARYTGLPQAVAVASCTAGLLVLLSSLNLQPGDEVITTPLSFASTAHTIVQAGGRPVFADVDPQHLNLDPQAVAACIGPRTRAVVVVHLGGNPASMAPLQQLCQAHGLALVEDCAHALEAQYDGRPVGSFGIGGSFSFYPNKNMTTGEGGMVGLTDPERAHQLRLWRNHGLDYPPYEREKLGGFRQYDILLPGYKLNLPDLQAALGQVQLQRVPAMWQRRRELFDAYVAGVVHPAVQWVLPPPNTRPALHLCMLQLDPGQLRCTRDALIGHLNQRGIGVSVNFKPIHLFSYYRERWGTRPGLCPVAEAAWPRLLSLPLYPRMTNEDLQLVLEALNDLLRRFAQ